MERFFCIYRKVILSLAALGISSSFAATIHTDTIPEAPKPQPIWMLKRPGFFRFNYDNLSMPNKIKDMGFLGFNYFADITPEVYGGIGVYGSVAGTQGGLFVFGLGGGLHKEFAQNWWGDVGFFAGGGGGRSSLVGGGLMLRPHIGLAYDFKWARLGLHYSYITFPSGLIHSKQVGLDFDVPFNFYYVPFQSVGSCPFSWQAIRLCDNALLGIQRNDFAILLQSYWQKTGTRNVLDRIQDGKISLVGAELDHYLTPRIFWWVKASGAYAGIPNGYMDVLGGFGYHYPLGLLGLAVVPQLGAGAGGGGNVDTGGGIIVQPRLGVELSLTQSFAARVDGGYIWAPKGELNAYTGTAALIYHLDVASASSTIANDITHNVRQFFRPQGWRVQIFNQTYLHPQRAGGITITSPINLVAFQFDQFFTPSLYFSYQAASAYSGTYAGGYATGMIGPGIQTPEFCYNRLQAFAQVLVGAGGGGSLALGGGAIVEPVVGLHFSATPTLGIQASAGQLRAVHHNLNTPVFNLGITIRFATLNKI